MKIAIIGGGACGVICAIKLKKTNPNLDVTIFEQNDRILKKVLKTGNGKCNITNHLISKASYNDYSLILNNQDVSVSNELESLGLVLKETTLGRVYPYSESAKTVVNVLLRNIEKYHVNVKTNYLINDIKYKNNKYYLNDEIYDTLVIATGSFAQEKTNGYQLLKKLGHTISALRPGLVPIITEEKTAHLQGIRSKTIAKVNKQEYNGEILFKNDGISGILALDLSRVVKVSDVISFDLMPEFSEDKIRSFFNENNIIDYKDILEGIFPKALALDILKRSTDLDSLVKTIKNYNFTVKGFKDYKEAQITIGGVNLSEIDYNFKSIINPNLYIGGEVLNVDGACGGYNLYFAWLSGIVIAKEILKDNK